MKKFILTLTFLLTLGIYASAETLTGSTDQLASVTTSTAINTSGMTGGGCAIIISNTATAELQCKVLGGAWETIAGTSTTATSSTDIGRYCSEVRGNVTVFTSGTIDFQCEWTK